MTTLVFLLGWCLLWVVCWPIALLFTFALPFLLFLTIPLRLLWICLHAILSLVHGLLLLPARLLGWRRA